MGRARTSRGAELQRRAFRFIGVPFAAIVVVVGANAGAQGAAPPAPAPSAASAPADSSSPPNAPAGSQNVLQIGDVSIAPTPAGAAKGAGTPARGAGGAATPAGAAATNGGVAAQASTLPNGPAATGTPDTRGAAMRAYQAALAAAKLGSTTPLSIEQIQRALADDEAIGDLVYLIESPRFAPFASLDEGRTATFLLGDAFGRAGAYDPARAYLLPLLAKNPPDVWTRRAVRSLVDFGLASDTPDVFLADLSKLPPGMPEELTSDVAYLAGRAAVRNDKDDDALAEFAKVTPKSRFWAQATYLSGLIEVDRRQFKQGEQQFCKVADVKQTPRAALAFGGSDFFEVRDMARLGLGRIAHEQYRFDDSRYYYYLVPGDSERLPEALYESANSRYEAKDYRGARDLLDEMRSRGEHSPYDDEVWIFDAYVDLALCEFPKADEKLKEFIRRYEPVRDTARRVIADEKALSDLEESVRGGADPGAVAAQSDAASLRTLAEMLRRDGEYGQATRRLTELDHQMSGLRQAMASLDDANLRLSSPKEVRPRSTAELSGTEEERKERVQSELAEVRRLIRQAKDGGHAADVAQLEQELAALESRAQDALSGAHADVPADASAPGLPGLVAGDRKSATDLYATAQATRRELVLAAGKAARDSLIRLDRRLSRLLRRARLGRIETVLGKKRSLEVEIEALTEGFLPQGAVDSLDAARYLKDDEEYWPFDGEDWADEYVGGEGLR